MEAQNTVSLMGSAPGSLPDNLQIWLWVSMAVYVAVLLGLGWLSSKKIKGMNDFLVAGRRLPLWMATAHCA